MKTSVLDLRSPMAAARLVRCERYAWPGGYPLALVCTDGQLLCADCTKENFHSISVDTRDNYRGGWGAAGFTSGAEADREELCACCGEPIFGIEDEGEEVEA